MFLVMYKMPDKVKGQPNADEISDSDDFEEQSLHQQVLSSFEESKDKKP